MTMNNKRNSHDSGCDESFKQKRDDESIYSTRSTSSSMFSASSRMSKIPNAVKSSVKYLVRRKNKTKEETEESLAAKLKRHTITNIFNSRNKRQQEAIIPTATSSSTLFNYKNNSTEFNNSKRRNSVVNLASRFLYKSSLSTSTLQEEQVPDKQIVGELLFGKQVDDLEIFVHHESDSKSEKVTQVKKQEPWVRQRAKSCQENKAPMLHQLANKGSSTKLTMDLPENDSIPYKSTIKITPSDLPLFKGLVTTTLTTLHTRLTNECDRVLSLVLLVDNHSSPKEQLLSIISDLYKMTEMVNWESQNDQKKEIKEMISMIEQTILNQALNIIIIKDLIANMKQIMNTCICQYYKVVEKAMIIPSKGYKIEGINKYGTNMILPPATVKQHKTYTVDHMDPEAHWYRTYFLDCAHVYTFFGYNEDGEPILLSVKVEENKDTDTNRQFRIIYRTKEKDERKVILDSFLLNAPSTENDEQENNLIPDSTWKSLIESTIDISFHNFLKMDQELMISSGIQDELLRLDENSLHTRYKFGVLLIKEGQTREEEWFSNGNDSEAFNEFLNIIGSPIELKGYTGWAAGLDTKSGDSGEYTFINHWNENILAYHVSTLIPSRPGDKQQIQRKRHIGNDIVCIVFVQGNQPFNPTAIKSQFLHVFIVVHQEICNNVKLWRVEIVSVKDVPSFGPCLPENSAVFYDEKELEQFLLAKLVNAEYAAFKSPKFAVPMSRAREGIFTNLVEKGWKLLFNESSNTTHIDNTIIQNNNTTNNNNIPTSSPSPSSSSSSLRKQLNHTKSASISSSQSSLVPSPSKSNVIRDFSEGIIGRRRSVQDLTTTITFKKSSVVSRGRKFTEGSSKRSHSEQDLINITLENNTKNTTSLKNRAQNLFTSIPGFGNHI